MIKLLHPKLRFEGWEPMGLYKRPADTRTVEELKGTIEAWSRRVSDVKAILPELDSMNPKHLGLVADTIELSQKPANMFNDVDMVNPDERFGPFNPLEKLMAIFPIISHKNPHAMDFSQEVVDTTGKMMSKFYLKAAADTEFLLDDGVDRHFENAIPIVENIAKESMTVPAENYGREAEFVGSVLAIIEEDSDPVKIALLKDVYEALDNKCIKEFDFGDLIKSEVSPDVIKENLKTIKDDLGLAYGYGKIVNVNEYLTKNPEDKRIPFRNLDDTVLHRVTPEELTERFKTGNYI